MPSRSTTTAPLQATAMSRVAIVALPDRLRDALVEVARQGTVELDLAVDVENDVSAALRSLGGREPPGTPSVSPEAPDVAALVRDGRADLLAGELEVSRRAAAAITESGVSATAGWMPSAAVPPLRAALEQQDATVVELPKPRWVEPPSLLGGGGVTRQLRTLVDIYGPTRYRDVDPTPFAAASFVLVFGMMFADAGHGSILVLAGLWARFGRQRLARSLRRVWLYLVAAGLVASAFGAAFGEFFGPTRVFPAFWLTPLDEPLRLIVIALGAGATLLALSYVIGTVNRYREGGLGRALTAGSGAGGLTLFTGAALVALGFILPSNGLLLGGAGVAVVGTVLVIIGLYGESAGGGGAVPEVAVGTFDAVVRLGSNVMSFSRLAAFGLVHAAIGELVWEQSTSAWNGGGAGLAVAAIVFLVGNVIAFALEGLVVGVQALRLEYYELFSRIFVGEGRRFEPWHLPTVAEEATS